MSIEKELRARSGSKCELCGSEEHLQVYNVPPVLGESVEKSALVCGTCHEQIEDASKMDSNHWRCLNDSMWSEHTGVQVIAWRMLNRLRSEGWPQDLLDMLYLDEETLAFAKETGDHLDDSEKVIHKDSNGVTLQNGDSVVLIKDLNVKGSSMVAKRGTAVRNISLDRENATYIEGRVNGQMIVILTQYVKKT
ncbi:PhnA domain-containing protein [Sediminitomix flava]|uniref:Phosphonoacetate hydrolase n=1 Tax=Sediminitomix flava TaxID=379075 RepID=A0A315Z7E9_SEDFL|nr:alkylphosphonate utilization protein [Sediminitomix flava]PWJ40162.1 phosphonoacetate hydrolase [Sediminitomix flava]